MHLNSAYGLKYQLEFSKLMKFKTCSISCLHYLSLIKVSKDESGSCRADLSFQISKSKLCSKRETPKNSF